MYIGMYSHSTCGLSNLHCTSAKTESTIANVPDRPIPALEFATTKVKEWRQHSYNKRENTTVPIQRACMGWEDLGIDHNIGGDDGMRMKVNSISHLAQSKENTDLSRIQEM